MTYPSERHDVQDQVIHYATCWIDYLQTVKTRGKISLIYTTGESATAGRQRGAPHALPERGESDGRLRWN